MDWPYDDKLQMNLKISKPSKSQTKKEHVSGVGFYLQKGKSVGAECMQEVPGAVGR